MTEEDLSLNGEDTGADEEDTGTAEEKANTSGKDSNATEEETNTAGESADEEYTDDPWEDDGIIRCPACGEPFELGTFRNRGGDYFLPYGEKEVYVYSKKNLEKRRAITLLPETVEGGKTKWPTAFACRHCKFVMIPY